MTVAGKGFGSRSRLRFADFVRAARNGATGLRPGGCGRRFCLALAMTVALAVAGPAEADASGARAEALLAPAAGVPARRTDLAGLPPVFIGVGAIDLFVDEDIGYAKRLIDAGVPTELLVVPGAFHGFDAIGAGTVLGKQFSEAKIAALKRAFENAGAE